MTTVVAIVGALVLCSAVPAAAEPAARPAPDTTSAVFVEFDQPSALQQYESMLHQGAELARGAARASGTGSRPGTSRRRP